MADDPFPSLFPEEGPIVPSPLAYINSTPFLEDVTLPSPPSSPPPPSGAAEIPTLNCALAQAQSELEPGPEPETEPDHGLGLDGQAPPPPPLEMVGVGDDVVAEVPVAKEGYGLKRALAPKPKPAPAAKAADLDPLVQAVSMMTAKLHPKLEDVDILKICSLKGIDFAPPEMAPPRWLREGEIFFSPILFLKKSRF